MAAFPRSITDIWRTPNFSSAKSLDITESSQSSPGKGSASGISMMRSSLSMACAAALSFFWMAWSNCFSSPVNIETCLVAVMMRGLSAGFTGSCAAENIIVAINTGNKHAKKRTRILRTPCVGNPDNSNQERRSRTDVCILFLSQNKSSMAQFGTKLFYAGQCVGAKKAAPQGGTAFVVKKKLVGKERAAQGLVATAATAVFPFHLDHPVQAAKGLVELGAVGSRLRGTDLEVALVGIFVAAGVKPGIQVRIGDGFFRLVGENVRDAVHAASARSRAIRAGRLDFAAVGALVHVADVSVLNVRAVNRSVGVEAAIGPAEARSFAYVRRRENDVNAVGIIWQTSGHRAADDSGERAIAEFRAGGIVVKHMAAEIQMAAHVAGRVAVRGVDGFVAGAAERVAAQEQLNRADRELAIRRLRAIRPVTVPDDVNRNGIGLRSESTR